MTTTTAIAVALTAVGFPVLLWAIGRAVTALGARAPVARGERRHYLAGLLHGVQITSVIDGQDELLVSLATQTTHNTSASGGQLAGVFRISARECSLARVKRWQQEGTALRAYLSYDGAIMLADPALGGNAPCEPPITITQQTHEQTVSRDRPPRDT